jgi:hypothetical protein
MSNKKTVNREYLEEIVSKTINEFLDITMAGKSSKDLNTIYNYMNSTGVGSGNPEIDKQALDALKRVRKRASDEDSKEADFIRSYITMKFGSSAGVMAYTPSAREFTMLYPKVRDEAYRKILLVNRDRRTVGVPRSASGRPLTQREFNALMKKQTRDKPNPSKSDVDDAMDFLDTLDTLATAATIAAIVFTGGASVIAYGALRTVVTQGVKKLGKEGFKKAVKKKLKKKAKDNIKATKDVLKTPAGKAAAATAVTYGSLGPEFIENVYDLTINYAKTFLAQTARSLQGGRTNQGINNTNFPSDYSKYEKTIKSFFSLYRAVDYKNFKCVKDRKKSTDLSCEPTANYTHKIADEVFGRAVAEIPNVSGRRVLDYKRCFLQLKKALPLKLDVISDDDAKNLANLAHRNKTSLRLYSALCLYFVYNNISPKEQVGTENWLKSSSEFLSSYINRSTGNSKQENPFELEESSDTKLIEGPQIGSEIDRRARNRKAAAASDVDAAADFFEFLKNKIMMKNFESEEFRKAYNLFSITMEVDPSNSTLDMESIGGCLEMFKALRKDQSPEELEKTLKAKDKESKYSWGEEFVSFMIFSSPENLPIDYALKAGGVILARIATTLAPTAGAAAVQAAKAKSWIGIVLSLSVMMGFYLLDPFNKVQKSKIIKLLDKAIQDLEIAKSKAEEDSGEGGWVIEDTNKIMQSFYKAMASLSEELHEAVDATWTKQSSISSDECEILSSRLQFVQMMKNLNLSVKSALNQLSQSEIQITDENYEKTFAALKESKDAILHTFDNFKTADTGFMIREDKTKKINFLESYINKESRTKMTTNSKLTAKISAKVLNENTDTDTRVANAVATAGKTTAMVMATNALAKQEKDSNLGAKKIANATSNHGAAAAKGDDGCFDRILNNKLRTTLTVGASIVVTTGLYKLFSTAPASEWSISKKIRDFVKFKSKADVNLKGKFDKIDEIIKDSKLQRSQVSKWMGKLRSIAGIPGALTAGLIAYFYLSDSTEESGTVMGVVAKTKLAVVAAPAMVAKMATGADDNMTHKDACFWFSLLAGAVATAAVIRVRKKPSMYRNTKDIADLFARESTNFSEKGQKLIDKVFELAKSNNTQRGADFKRFIDGYKGIVNSGATGNALEAQIRELIGEFANSPSMKGAQDEILNVIDDINEGIGKGLDEIFRTSAKESDDIATFIKNSSDNMSAAFIIKTNSRASATDAAAAAADDVAGAAATQQVRTSGEIMSNLSAIATNNRTGAGLRGGATRSSPFVSAVSGDAAATLQSLSTIASDIRVFKDTVKKLMGKEVSDITGMEEIADAAADLLVKISDNTAIVNELMSQLVKKGALADDVLTAVKQVDNPNYSELLQQTIIKRFYDFDINVDDISKTLSVIEDAVKQTQKFRDAGPSILKNPNAAKYAGLLIVGGLLVSYLSDTLGVRVASLPSADSELYSRFPTLNKILRSAAGYSVGKKLFEVLISKNVGSDIESMIKGPVFFSGLTAYTRGQKKKTRVDVFLETAQVMKDRSDPWFGFYSKLINTPQENSDVKKLLKEYSEIVNKKLRDNPDIKDKLQKAFTEDSDIELAFDILVESLVYGSNFAKMLTDYLGYAVKTENKKVRFYNLSLVVAPDAADMGRHADQIRQNWINLAYSYELHDITKKGIKEQKGIKTMKILDLRKIVSEVLSENYGQGYADYPYHSQVGNEEEEAADFVEDWKDFEMSLVRDESRNTAIEVAKILVKDLELFGDVLDLVGQNQSVATEILKNMRKNEEKA